MAWQISQSFLLMKSKLGERDLNLNLPFSKWASDPPKTGLEPPKIGLRPPQNRSQTPQKWPWTPITGLKPPRIGLFTEFVLNVLHFSLHTQVKT